MIRLMSIDDYSLHTFAGDSIPKYAILSHRWEDEEVTFQDLLAGTAQQRAGFEKVRQLCHYAASNDHRFVWMDTCCIDKSSSAELSEAINSMFKWYRKASVCYAYLCDVSSREAATNLDDWQAQFRRSVWFTRGWTLQELIAPRNLVFISNVWDEIGTRRSLSSEVSAITRIPETPLAHGWSLHDQFGAMQFCTAQVLSWASKRRTMLVEDIAYSLMGLLHINMPLLYGEGMNAFIRLQLEVMAKYDDHSLFAWRIPPGAQHSAGNRVVNKSLGLHEDFWWGSLLAPTVRLFEGCEGFILHPGRLFDGIMDSTRPFSMTSRGILAERRMRVYGRSRHGGKRWLLPLSCGRIGQMDQRFGLLLNGDGQSALRVVNTLGFEIDLVDCDDFPEIEKFKEYEIRKVYIPQAWPADFD
jgi:hypothetical protein